MLDSSLNFMEAVNEIIAKYSERGASVFILEPSSYGFKRFASWKEPQSEKAYQELTQTVTRYRNALVHRKPVFVLTHRMPQQEYISQWSGLAAICKAAQNRKKFSSQFEMVSKGYTPCLPKCVQPWKESGPPPRLHWTHCSAPKSIMMTNVE
jgi:hypothetical protein